MHIPTLIKYLVLAWGVPIAIVLVVRTFTPDPGQDRANFSQQSFKPARVWVAEKSGTKGSDYFELRIESPNGEEFFHRNPEGEPILDLERQFPINTEVEILYSPGLEGNVLMEIVATDPESAISILSFDAIMGEYASRRRVVYIVAGVWCVLANLFSFALWKVDISESAQDQTKPEQGGAGQPATRAQSK